MQCATVLGAGEARGVAGEPLLPPRQQHPHHRRPQGEEPQGQGHQREIRLVKTHFFVLCKNVDLQICSPRPLREGLADVW